MEKFLILDLYTRIKLLEEDFNYPCHCSRITSPGHYCSIGCCFFRRIKPRGCIFNCRVSTKESVLKGIVKRFPSILLKEEAS